MADVEPTESTNRLAGLFDGREEYAPPPPDGKSVALAEGLVVVDTNVLLHLYRFGPEARDELLKVLELLGGRLFIPAQVASEFARLRLSVAMEMRNELQKGADGVGDNLQKLGEELMGFGRHRGLSQQQQQRLTKALKRAEKSVRALLDEAAQDRAWAESPSTPDPLLPEITKLLDGKVGKAYPETHARELREEADKRIKAKIPPGWKDADKADPAGDYLLWRQTLDEAAERRLPIFLVTDDVKEDWYLRVHGRTVGPHPQLVREARDEAGADLYMSDVARFLELAREVLAADVSEGTIEEATRRPSRRDQLLQLGALPAGSDFPIEQILPRRNTGKSLDELLRNIDANSAARAALLNVQDRNWMNEFLWNINASSAARAALLNAQDRNAMSEILRNVEANSAARAALLNIASNFVRRGADDSLASETEDEAESDDGS